jgi:hypothetical protein
MNRFVWVLSVSLVLACSPKPKEWVSPPVSLPLSQHAYALAVRSVAMVSSTLSFEQVEEMKEACAELEPPHAVELELEEEEQETHAPETHAPETHPASQEREVPTESLIELLATDLPDLVEHKDEAVPAVLPKPLPLPDHMLEPAALSISLDEISWMGTVVAQLKNGVLEDGEHDNAQGPYHFAPLAQAVTFSIDATKSLLRSCGSLPWPAGPAALLVVDARVPMTTFNLAVYNLSMAGVNSFAVAVIDESPETSRLAAPVGGEDRIGTLKETKSGYTWESRQTVHGGYGYEDEPPERSPAVSFPRDAPLPSGLGETSNPMVDLLVNTRSPFSSLVGLIDELAGSKTYCVSLGLGDDSFEPTAAAVSEKTQSLRLDVRETVAAHLISSPFRGPGYTRIDGSRCSRSIHIQVEKRPVLPKESTPPLGLKGTLGAPSLKDVLDADFTQSPRELPGARLKGSDAPPSAEPTE